MGSLLARLWARIGRGWSAGGAVAVLALAVLVCSGPSLAAQPQDQPRGLTKEQVVRLLKEDPPARVQYLVNKYGIGFTMSAQTESELRDAGATPELMDLVRKLAPQPPAEVKPPSPPPPPTLLIDAKPPEAEVYVDNERRGQTGGDGALRLGDVTAGSHKVRISMTGFHSYEVNVNLVAAQTTTVVAELQPLPPPAPAPKEEPAKEAVKPAAPVEEKPRGDPDDPMTPHAPGIYYLEQSANARHMMELEEAPPASRAPQSGRSGLGAFGGFGGPKWKSMIFGSKAHLRVAAGRPVFYFYFPTVQSDASTFGVANDAFRHTSTPNGFVLVHLQTGKNLREIPAKGSVTATVEEKNTEPFDYEKAGPGIYKVVLKGDLGPGEYGFLYGGMLQATTQTWLFDFGIDKTK